MKKVLLWAMAIIGIVLCNKTNAEEIIIGTGTSNASYPLSTSYLNARTQVIYFSSEIGIAKQLTGLGLYVSTKPGQTLNNFTIRLKHTNLTTFTTSSTWESSGWTTVYQSNQVISVTGWMMFSFTTPFVYNGTQNLMVDISFENPSYTYDGQCRISSSGSTRSITKGTNGNYENPLTWSERAPIPALSIGFPNIRLKYNGTIVTVPHASGKTQAEAQSEILSAGLSIGNITYTFSESIPAGQITSQSPASNQSVHYGTYVNLVVSSGIRYLGNGTIDSPYQINSKWHLLGLSSATADYKKYFILTADIDMKDQPVTTAIIAPDTDGNQSGFQGTSFAGYFDGNNHTISNLNIQGGNNLYLGLFGAAYTGSVIKNINLENCIVTSSTDSRNIGALAGLAYFCTISNCYGFSNVTGGANTGGLIGFAFRSTIERCGSSGQVIGSFGVGGLAGSYEGNIVMYCYSSGTITAKVKAGGLIGSAGGTNIQRSYSLSKINTSTAGEHFGGLLGICSSTTITNCFASGEITSSHDGSYYGGLIGSNWISNNISYSYAIGTIYTTGSTNETIGGLVGLNYASQINNCYSSGDVIASGENARYIGGFVGWNETSGMISNSYSTGKVAGHNLAGGFAGIADSTNIQKSFWDIQTSEQLNGIGTGINSGLSGKTSNEMKNISTYISAGWDFAEETANGTIDAWQLCTDGLDYPRFIWDSINGDFICPNGIGISDVYYFASRWLMNNCTSDNLFCEKTDLNRDGVVSIKDFAIVAENWLDSK